MRSVRPILFFLLPFVAGILTDRMLIERPAMGQTSGKRVAIRPPETLQLANVTLRIGASKNDALAALSDYNILKSDENNVFVTTKTAEGTPLGGLVFSDGLVSEISRNWDLESGNPKTEKIWKALWGAVTTFILPQGNIYSVRIKATETSSPQSLSQSLAIGVTSNRSIVIQRLESEDEVKGIAAPNHVAMAVTEIVH